MQSRMADGIYSVSTTDHNALQRLVQHTMQVPQRSVVRKMEDTFLQQYRHVLCQGIEDVWSSESFTDVVICVGEKQYSCHKMILSALSHYFTAMFRSGMRESRDASIVLQNVDSETFEHVLRFIYTGCNVITLDNVESLLEAAVMLQIKCLQEQCEAFLKQHIGPENCLGVWSLASTLNCVSLAKESWTYILEYFQTVVLSKEFCQISVDDLISIINDDDLNTNSEEAVCDAVIRWVEADQENRQGTLETLFGYLRFPLISLEYIESLKKNDLVSSSEFCKSMLDKMYGYITSPESDGQTTGCSRQFQHRQEEMMCLIGTRSRHPNPQTTELKCFSFRRDAEYSMAPLPEEPGACFAACKLKDDVYISGGYHGQNLLLRYVSRENRWKQCSPLLEGRWGHSMVAAGGMLYIIGGCTQVSETLSSIECYDPMLNECRLVGGLAIPVSFMPVAAIGSRIFIFGGKMGDRNISTKIQCFDTKRKGRCFPYDEMPLINCTSSRVAVLDNTAYIFYRQGSIVVFNEGSTVTVETAMPNFDHFGVAPHQGQILIAGSQSNQCSTYLFNPLTREMTPHTWTIKPAICNFHCMSIVMSKQHLNAVAADT